VSIIVDMKYLLSIIALALSLNAQGIPDHPPGQGENRRKPPEISKEFREEMLKKYDTNKDGKLDKEERSKISSEDRKKVGPPRRGPKGPPPSKKG
jgi:hypothetical protein